MVNRLEPLTDSNGRPYSEQVHGTSSGTPTEHLTVKGNSLATTSEQNLATLQHKTSSR